ncbi:hypothetical protein CEXT_146501 [Caerostris extrusa]|uniref:Uncharacterized protein n=1 Tax=Caerostris extrusa TaxID=172846 RepID=A0AAV4MIJ1_CAEEX|nr:hypothetical protein CEXT_146501 [Caerostris extrusa]
MKLCPLWLVGEVLTKLEVLETIMQQDKSIDHDELVDCDTAKVPKRTCLLMLNFFHVTKFSRLPVSSVRRHLQQLRLDGGTNAEHPFQPWNHRGQQDVEEMPFLNKYFARQSCPIAKRKDATASLMGHTAEDQTKVYDSEVQDVTIICKSWNFPIAILSLKRLKRSLFFVPSPPPTASYILLV